MKLNTFRDGDRLVIVVEGLKNLPTDEALLKGLLSSCTENAEAEVIPPADAIPVPVEEDPFIISTSFYAGPFDGVFSYVDSMKKELELLNALGDNAEMYLSVKFSKLNAKEYSDKLSVQQKEAFFRIYGKYLPEPLAEAGDVQKVIEYYHEQT